MSISWEKKKSEEWRFWQKKAVKSRISGLSEKSDAKNQGVAKCCTFPYVELHPKNDRIRRKNDKKENAMKAVILVVFVLTVAAVLCLLEAYREQQYFKVTEDGVVSRRLNGLKRKRRSCF